MSKIKKELSEENLNAGTGGTIGGTLINKVIKPIPIPRPIPMPINRPVKIPENIKNMTGEEVENFIKQAGGAGAFNRLPKK